MPARKEIPTLSTQDLWNRYVNSDEPFTSYFRGRTEDFLITRLEDARHLLALPTEPHRRDVNEIVFVTGGKVIRGANLSKIEVSSGEIHLLLANQISTVDFLSDDLKGFYCHFSFDTIVKLYRKEQMLHELTTLSRFMKLSSLELRNKVLSNVKAIFERMLDEYQTNNDVYLIDAYLIALFYEIKNSISKESIVQKTTKSDQITERLKQLIVKHIYRDQSISFYAEQLCVSPNHLNKAVRQATGKSASAIIHEMLILEAKVLIKHSALSISEIGYKLGFADQSYFSRFFKSRTGQTPTGYKTSK